MTVEQLKKAYSAQPFKPFDVRLADGRSIEVPHPEFLAMSPTGRTVIIVRPDGDYHVVDLLLVTDLVVHHSAEAGGSNESNRAT
jgi:hypothetical protein